MTEYFKMKLLLLIVEVVLILKILTNVESQFIPPQMGGMQFPQLLPLPQMPQMPMNMNMGAPPPMPMNGMPMPMPMSGLPMPMPMSFMGPPKMPMVVMPYHNKKLDKQHNKKSQKSKKDKRKKKKKKKKYIPVSSSSDDSDSSSSSDVSGPEYRSMKKNLKHSLQTRKNKKRSRVLTPVISYVTKDGYIIYQKKIKKDKAKDWLEMGKRSANGQDGGDKLSSSEEILRKVIRHKLDKAKSEKY